METWFTSDLHLGHVRIIELCNRPFADVREMNRAIIENWNRVVQPLDRVFVLGDVALGKLNETLPLIKKLNGGKFLVPGNHDRCWSGHKKVRPIDIQRYQDVGFVILSNEITLQRSNWKLCHFPQTGDSHDTDRYKEHRPTLETGQWLIHGHVHEKWKVRGRQINVGVDVWNFTPVHEETLKNIVVNQRLASRIVTGPMV